MLAHQQPEDRDLECLMSGQRLSNDPGDPTNERREEDLTNEWEDPMNEREDLTNEREDLTYEREELTNEPEPLPNDQRNDQLGSTNADPEDLMNDQQEPRNGLEK